MAIKIEGNIMQYLKFALLEEFLDGAIIRLMLTKPFGPYSSSWYRKTFHPSVESIDVRKIKKKLFENFHLKYQFEVNRLTIYDLDAAPEQAVPPEINVEFFESLAEEVPPIAAYLSRDIAKPLEIGTFENSERHALKAIEWFPYCHWWGVDESVVKGGKRYLESTIDGCLMIFTCFYIDAEMTMDLSRVIDEILLEGVHDKYDPNYGVIRYVNFKLNMIKQSPDLSFEDLYDHWAKWDDAPDRESIEKLLKRWRKGIVTPSSKLFGDFVHLFGDGTFRGFITESELVGFFLMIQLIQKYRLSEGGGSRLLTSDSFYRERVHFWHGKLTEQYSDVLERRASEKESKESGPE